MILGKNKNKKEKGLMFPARNVDIPFRIFSF